MDEHLAEVGNIHRERQGLKAIYAGDMLRTKTDEVSEKARAQREKAIARINELEAAGLDRINGLIKSGGLTDAARNDLLLLDDRIFPVDQEVFDRLADIYKDNFPMTQAICKYAADHADNSTEGKLSAKAAEGFIKFDLPMTIQQTRDMLTSSVSACRGMAFDASNVGTGTQSVGYKVSLYAGSLKNMIDMG